jgi:hypothetical protein
MMVSLDPFATPFDFDSDSILSGLSMIWPRGPDPCERMESYRNENRMETSPPLKQKQKKTGNRG